MGSTPTCSAALSPRSEAAPSSINSSFFHLAASKFFDAINIVAAAFVEASHVVARLLALAPTFIVEGICDILIVTVFITVWMTLRVATFCLVNVEQIGWRTSAEPHTLHVVTIRAQCPDIKSIQRVKPIRV